MAERILIAGGRREGRTLQFEHVMRAALAEGKTVFTGPRNGVWFEVTAREDGALNYFPHTKRPEGV
jgi:hypothetical protein